MSWRSVAGVVALAGSLAAAPVPGRAQAAPAGAAPPAPPAAEVADPAAPREEHLRAPALYTRWEGEEARPFAAVLAEAGTLLHLRLMAGHGQPYWQWVGLVGDAWVNGQMASATAGLRAVFRAVNADVHYRVTRSWSRVPMAPSPSHATLATGGGSTQRAVDGLLWGGLPTPHGYVIWEGQATLLLGLPRDVHVFDEATHAVVRPPWCGQASLGWVADLAGGDLQVGATAEVAFLGRGGDLRWRTGPLLAWTISRHWLLRAQLLWPVSGPDALPVADELGGGLLLGWRDATGPEPAP